MAELIMPKYQLKSLPSGGISYPPDWEIFIEPYKFQDSSTVGYNSIASKRFYNQILSGVYTNFPKKLITVADAIFLGIARKLVTVDSDKVILESTCPACLQKISTEMSFKDMIKFKASPIKNPDKYPVKVTFSEYVAWFRMLTADDYVTLLAQEEVTPADRLAKSTYKLVQIDKMSGDEIVLHDPENNGSVKKLSELSEIYGKFVGRDSEILDKVLEIFEPLDLEQITIKCTNKDCENEFKRTIAQEELTSVLQPFRPESRGVPEDAIDL